MAPKSKKGKELFFADITSAEEYINWKLVRKILKENQELVKQYKTIMKQCYGTFVGNDWQIAVAYLIQEAKKH